MNKRKREHRMKKKTRVNIYPKSHKGIWDFAAAAAAVCKGIFCMDINSAIKCTLHGLFYTLGENLSHANFIHSSYSGRS